MSLGIVIKGPEGVVLSADSRLTLTGMRALQDGSHRQFEVNFDNASKLLHFSEPHNFVGAVTYGAAVIGARTAQSFIPEFEVSLKDKRLRVVEYAERLASFFSDQWNEAIEAGDINPEHPGPAMNFIVGGYDKDAAYGSVFVISVPSQLKPDQRNAQEAEFGMTWGGQLEVLTRLVAGYDPSLFPILQRRFDISDDEIRDLQVELARNLDFSIPYQVLPLQDCVDLALLLIRTTIQAQALSVGTRGVGGMVEVATITRTEGLSFVQQKKLRGDV